MAATHTLPLASPGMARICLYGDLQRFRLASTFVSNGGRSHPGAGHAIPASSETERRLVSGTGLPGGVLVRVSGQVHETLPDGADGSCSPESPGPSQVAYSRLSWGLPPLPDHSFCRSHPCSMGGSHRGRWHNRYPVFSLGASMVLGGVAQMLAPEDQELPRTQTTDNGKQNTYFSSLDNMVAQGNVLPVLYGEMRVGSRQLIRRSARQEAGDGGQVVVIKVADAKCFM